VIKARGNRKISWAATIVLIIAITGLSYVGYIGYALIRYFVCIPAQGAISGVMPDTSWIKESRDVLYLNGDKLYSIKINGTDKKLIYDNVRYYALSPNGKKIVIEYLSKSLIKDDRNIGNLSLVDTETGNIEPIEEKADCHWPLWTADGARIFYEYSDSYVIRIYDLASKTKKDFRESKMVADVVASNIPTKLFYSSLFDKKCYDLDVITLQRMEIAPFRNTQGSTLDNCVKESDIYRAVQGGSEIRGWKVESPDLKKCARSEDGSLWLKTETKDERLVQYTGKYDSKIAPGIWPSSWSSDGRYLVSNFKGKIYVSDTVSNKTGYLTDGGSARIIN
jgi:hypothetical protein